MQIEKVDVDELKRITRDGGGFSIAGRVSFMLADSAAGHEVQWLRVEASLPLDEQAGLQELEDGLIERALELAQVLAQLPAEEARAAYRDYLETLPRD